ncbi:hypothetical protein [uncultured Ruegeria sp.]|uniref:hypothetical protein n=1 Tax=uncultured Ruegeria sp. TaxID=259304 RepID=UPI00260A37A0|nr:hypothetical protein [uncultured Ruegeria sp.]
MQLPIFVAGLFLSVLVSAVIGYAAGFSSAQLVLFVIAVTVLLQLVYVLVVALLAVDRKRKTQAADDRAPTVPPAQVSPKSDA